jgi:hypothetical protein
MREIDQSDTELREALRHVAAATGHDAPAALGDSLMHRFRKHHARRRRIRLGAVTVVAATVLVAVILSTRPTAVRGPLINQPNVAGNESVPPIRSVQTSAPSPVKKAQAHRKRIPHRAPTPDFNGFLALDSYDPNITGQLQIVRLELPGADLRLVGAPVSEDLARRRVLADFVVGQDGTPYAVRLVTSSN